MVATLVTCLAKVDRVRLAVAVLSDLAVFMLSAAKTVGALAVGTLEETIEA